MKQQQTKLRQVVKVIGAIDLMLPACVQPFHGWQHGSPGSTPHRQGQCLAAIDGVAETPTPSLNSTPRPSPQVQSQQMLFGCDLNSLTQLNPKTLTSGTVCLSRCSLEVISTPSLNSVPRHSPQVQSHQMLLRCDLNSLIELNSKTLTSGTVSANAP